MPEKEIVWSRKQLRMNVLDAIDAEMRIEALGGRPVKTNTRKVLLMDLSPDSLRFKTTLWMPPHEEWTVLLSFRMEGVLLEVAGKIIQADGEDQWWTYEVELERDPVKRIVLMRVLNRRLQSRAPLLYRMHEAYRKQLWE
ncbi:hypothetical protein [Cohnella candidum]|uniref:PilZ domain-containing protein n=1 Tax=Cohnella candidum TaxID=2674991 RepID=A0A3G3K023_9BACL|nr:hypothetical protein [Cohnella candidum]AYQ73854.1 hypothetical protein EAV92_15465 [Cohnella candidum]